MTGYTKLSITKLFLIFSIVVVIGCEQKEIPSLVVAKVGDQLLTEQKLDSLLSFSQNVNKYREEVIRDWIETEILFLEAEKNGVLSEQNYLQLIDESNKKVAIALFLKDYIRNESINIDEPALLNYYNLCKDEMNIANKAYVYNRVVFYDENKAILFRSTLLESDWNKTVNVFSGDESIQSIVNEKYLYDYQIPSQTVKLVLDNLEEGETSIIFETEPDIYNLVQLLRKFEPNSVPDFQYVKETVKMRYIATQQSQLYDLLIQDLYSKYDVIINR